MEKIKKHLKKSKKLLEDLEYLLDCSNTLAIAEATFALVDTITSMEILIYKELKERQK